MRAQTVRRLLLLLLLVSALLRIALVRSGGQYYWPDEGRYEEAQRIVQALAAGDVDVVFGYLDRAGPLLYKVLAVGPATVEFVLGENPRVPALFFAAFSVLNIWLIGRLAKGLGASDLEALLASTLLAMSSSFFYFTRHLLPYDVAMTCALGALYVGTRSGSSLRDAFMCGVLAACAFFTYNGYWVIAGAALLLSAWSHLVPEAIRRLLIATAGFFTVAIAIIGTDALLGGALLQSYVEFAGNVTQGSFAEGWRLPLEYLWYAEHGLLIVWLVCLALCVATVRTSLASPRVRVGLLGLLIVFSALAAGSTLLEKFVVYGRLSRQLVPFFCLIAAYVLARLWESRTRAVRMMVPAAIIVLAVQAAVNFSQPMTQTFPDDLKRQYGPIERSPLIWVNVEHIYPEPRAVVLPKRFVPVREAPHPLQFLPYQYEGYTPEQRRMLRTTDLTMRLIRPMPGD